MEKLLYLAAQYDGVKTKILPNGVQFKKDKKIVTYYPSTGTVVSDEKGKIKVHKRAGMELLKKELHAAFYQPVDLYGTCGASKPDMRSKEIKEYLVPSKNYQLQRSFELSSWKSWIEVPEGAEWAKLWDEGESYQSVEFYRGKNEFFSGSKKEWMRGSDQKENKIGQPARIIWQRNTQKSEYLVDIRGKWELQLLTDDTPESGTCVRVPDGANTYTKYKCSSDCDFLKIGSPSFILIGDKWEVVNSEYTSADHFIADGDTILWQRKETVVELMRKLSGKMSSDIFGRVAAFTHELPFTTPELSEEYQALCDRVEAIDKEAARYMREEAPMLDSFNNDGPLIESFNWEEPPHGYNYWSKLEKALLEPSSYNHIGEKQEAPCAAIGEHSHYFKDVSKLEVIDVYAVLELFGVTNPCMQHIVKKALCTGKRGHKDFAKDLQDIADTANRAVELNKQFYG